MKVRWAIYADIPRIMDLCREAHSVSHYAGQMPMSRDKQHKALSRMLAPSSKRTAVFVLSDEDRRIHGAMLAVMDYYWCNNYQYATDVLTYARKSAKGHGVKLYQAFLLWCERAPKCIEATLSISTDIVPVDFVERLYEKLGFERHGHVWSRYWYEKVQDAAPRKSA